VRLSQIAELARVKARIKALTDKTVANGCTEAEAMSAAEMVGRLLERYALSSTFRNFVRVAVRS
jgi:hypothetical protein